jgi:hypothetical protein
MAASNRVTVLGCAIALFPIVRRLAKATVNRAWNSGAALDLTQHIGDPVVIQLMVGLYEGALEVTSICLFSKA